LRILELWAEALTGPAPPAPFSPGAPGSQVELHGRLDRVHDNLALEVRVLAGPLEEEELGLLDARLDGVDAEDAEADGVVLQVLVEALEAAAARRDDLQALLLNLCARAEPRVGGGEGTAACGALAFACPAAATAAAPAAATAVAAASRRRR
jgi:hypothetical protein